MKKKMITLIIILFFIGIIISPISSSYIGNDEKTYRLENDGELNEFLFDKYITFLMRFAHKPSLSICIIKNDSVVWS